MSQGGRIATLRGTAKWLSLVAAGVLLLAAGLYGVAYLTTSRSGLSRAIVWMDADVADYQRFPWRMMDASEDPLLLRASATEVPSTLDGTVPGGDLASFLERSQTAAFIVLRDDRLLYEGYFNGYEAASTVTSFSVAKSYISTLVGIALSDGSIDSIDDPVTAYVPELLDRDHHFSRITIRHLLTMSSGLRWNEQGLPWSDDAQTYYATDLRDLAITDTEIVSPPGQQFVYNPYNTLLLGLILERSTALSVSDFMQDRLWEPMGAIAEGSWSLDSEASGFEKMESGLNARAIDMVKLGLVYLHGGRLNGHRIVPATWAEQATAVADDVDPSSQYQYQWWTYSEPVLGDWFAAQGNKGQFIAVFPSRNLVIGRFGIDFGHEDWPGLLAAMARSL